MTNFRVFLTHFDLQGAQKRSKITICPKSVTVLNLLRKIISLCKFATTRWLLLDRLVIFAIFNPYGTSESVKNCDLSYASDSIKSLMRDYLCVQVFSFCEVIFRGMDNF